MKKNTLPTVFTGVLLILVSQAVWSGSWNPTSSDSNSNTAGGSNALSSVTGTYNTGFGYGSLYKTTTGYMNTGLGMYSLLNNTTGYGNTAVGMQVLYTNSTGSYNTGLGTYALYGNTTGGHNVAIGLKALTGNTTSGYNVAVGNFTLQSNTTGTYNTAIGYNAGNSQTTGSNNIYIDNTGVAAESNTTRIGDSQTATYVKGIYGQSTSDSASSVAIYVDKNGKLGTLLSSERYKDEIHDMNEASQHLYELRPVTFRYKQASPEGNKPLEYGLIAEEVAKVYPDLVLHNEQGQVQTVQYHKLTPMLLNEVQHLNNELKAEKERSLQQNQEIAQLKQQIAQVVAQSQQLQALALKLNALAPELKQPLQLVNKAK